MSKNKVWLICSWLLTRLATWMSLLLNLTCKLGTDNQPNQSRNKQLTWIFLQCTSSCSGIFLSSVRWNPMTDRIRCCKKCFKMIRTSSMGKLLQLNRTISMMLNCIFSRRKYLEHFFSTLCFITCLFAYTTKNIRACESVMGLNDMRYFFNPLRAAAPIKSPPLPFFMLVN